MISDREILIERLINAPRERVWQAWANLEELEQWWGPDGFSVTTESFDMREGGAWKFIMHGPDGRDYPNFIRFTKIVAPERIDHDHGADDGEVLFQATVTFAEQDDKTLITMRTIFPSAEARDYVVKEHDAIEGGKQTLGHLAQHVENR